MADEPSGLEAYDPPRRTLSELYNDPSADRGRGSLDDLEPYGISGWQWTVHPDVGRTFKARTNRQGDGLFTEHVAESGLADWTQQTGTGQFQLWGTEAAIKAKIRRWHGMHLHWAED